ncbi:MAG: hypothetical protein COU08_02430 [Candidatus Harrisonbacteria bacterium CG10_big_fil_rev_8_21_14_0_10_42_17]|uniref:TIGR00374 family protein n=1 Tax=Candidatus Harrisonbacteria bacterium CG10_big_fil_rev_8_21_14_0_10_42_17 TaxID=1974584 RepID=A0A2M6WI11_9BACT|nr:MAG: hypothetical protein COU08_02430 [Candidatus Harrisonbacteria bacterium CG10_big_fil_rev_8_21_14_0_10_42_17]
MKKSLAYIARLVVTIGLLVVLVKHINVKEVLAIVKNVNSGWFIVALGVGVGGLVVNAMRWREILKASKVEIPIMTVLRCNLVGVFYGIILPGGKVTGDTISAYRLIKDTGGKDDIKKYIISIVADRFVGVFAILSVIFSFFIINHPSTLLFKEQKDIVGIGLALLIVGGLSLMFVTRIAMVELKIKKNSLQWVNNIITKINLVFVLVGREKSKIFRAIIFGVTGVLAATISVFMLANALGIQQTFGVIGFSYLLATALIIVPITIAGIGLREGGMIYFLTQLGVNTTEAAALSILVLVVFFGFAILGGLIEMKRIIL